MTTSVLAQVSSVASDDTVTVGDVMSSVMVTVSVDVQPLSESVMVKVYVPGALIVGVAVSAPLSIVPPVHA